MTRSVLTFVAYFVSESPLSVEVSQAIFLHQLRRLAAAEGWQQAETIIHAWYDHSLIKPQVGPDDINGGFNNEINALQGQKSAWWTGAAWQSQVTVPIWTLLKNSSAVGIGRTNCKSSILCYERKAVMEIGMTCSDKPSNICSVTSLSVSARERIIQLSFKF